MSNPPDKRKASAVKQEANLNKQSKNTTNNDFQPAKKHLKPDSFWWTLCFTGSVK